MNSLRGRLLLALVALHSLFAAMVLTTNYHQSEANITGFIDRQMHTLAISYSHRISDSAQSPPMRSVSDYAIQHQGAAVVEFWRPNGTLVRANRSLSGITLQPTSGFHDITARGRRWRVYTLPSSHMCIQTVTSDDFRRRVIWDSAWAAARPIIYLAPLSVALLWLIVHLALRPLDRLGQVLGDQDERSLSELDSARVPHELRPLIDSMNGLLKRLRTAFQAEQRFIQDAAHELRTPITAIKLQLENLRRKVTDSGAAEFAQLEAGIQRLQRTVEQLLVLARHEAVRPAIDPLGTVDLAELLRSAVRDLVPFAESRAVDLGLGEVDSATARLDRTQMRLVLDNLLDNAVRYSPPGGRIDVMLHRVPGAAVLEVTDSGPGIPVEELETVFARFYRGAGADGPGSGLGLAIARAAADRCSASIELLNRPDGTGLTARVRVHVCA